MSGHMPKRDESYYMSDLFMHGANAQGKRNAMLQPLWGKNNPACDKQERAGEQAANKAWMLAGGAGAAGLVGSAAVGFKMASKMPSGPAKLWTMGISATAGLVGAWGGLGALSGFRNSRVQPKCDVPKPEPKPEPKPSPEPPSKKVPAPTPVPPTPPTPEPDMTYTVRRGDVLQDIADCFDARLGRDDIRPDDIFTYTKEKQGKSVEYRSDGKVQGSNMIYPGDVLFIPPKGYHGSDVAFPPTGPRSLPKNDCFIPDSASPVQVPTQVPTQTPTQVPTQSPVQR